MMNHNKQMEEQWGKKNTRGREKKQIAFPPPEKKTQLLFIKRFQSADLRSVLYKNMDFSNFVF